MNDKQLAMIEDLPRYDGATESYVQGVADLFRWSENYDHPRPSALFLDLIGYSDDQYGETLYDYSKIGETLGYFELDQLADALKEYATNPSDVYRWVEAFMDAEVEDGESEDVAA